MPADNIKRGIQRGTGELPGVNYEEVTYEGYGPGGVAVLVDTMTDNKNRTLPEVRTIFSKHGGNLGESGSVKFLFQKKGYITIEKDKATEDQVMEAAIEAGADDVSSEGQHHEIQTAAESFAAVKEGLEKKGLPIAVAEISMIPTTEVKVDQRRAEQDDEAHGGTGRSRRRAARLGQLRFRRGELTPASACSGLQPSAPASFSSRADD